MKRSCVIILFASMASFFIHEYSKKSRELMQKYPGRENADKRGEEVAKQFGPAPKASWEKIIEHIDHAVKLVGIDHVGLGSDFDGGSIQLVWKTAHTFQRSPKL